MCKINIIKLYAIKSPFASGINTESNGDFLKKIRNYIVKNV